MQPVRIGGWLRATLLGGAVAGTGVRLMERLERRVAGGRPASVRAQIAHRALMARFFSAVKQLRR